MSEQARQAFRRCFGGQGNFMTPNVIGYREVGPWAVELSSGSGFEPGSTIFGVTVIRLDGTRIPEDDPSKGGFPTRALAERYIGELMEPWRSGSKHAEV